MSIGIAELPDHALDADSLLRAADRALYTAKNAGRNRTEIFLTEPKQRNNFDRPPTTLVPAGPSDA